MREIPYEQLGLTLYHEQLANGLQVYLLPRPGYRQVYATFTAHYGSVDSTFARDGGPVRTVPDGIAHFLEHKMFESPAGDVFNQFAAHGASANAFTSFDQTTYLFSCTEDVAENIRILLDFVQEPYFTDENVEKEKGIIAQEIRMYEDHPEARSFYGLLKALYHAHPVRTEIAGTVESIGQITKDLLYECYATFYHPSNMVFFAVGGLDPHALMDLIRDNQAKKSFGPPPRIARVLPDEPADAAAARQETRLAVSQPRCLIGWKEVRVGLAGLDLLRQELLTGMVLDALFGRSADLYHELLDEGVIDPNFTWEYELAPSYGYSLVGGNVSRPEAFIARATAAVARARREGIPKDVFERSRRKHIGRFLSGLDALGYVARHFTAYHLRQADLFATLDVLLSLRWEDANERLREHFAEERQAVSLVLPRD